MNYIKIHHREVQAISNYKGQPLAVVGVVTNNYASCIATYHW
jgi:hypothetical protein